MANKIYSIYYRKKHTWKNVFPCIAFKKNSFSLGTFFLLFFSLCGLSTVSLSFAVEEKTLESIEQSSPMQDKQEDKSELKSSVLRDTNESSEQNESIQITKTVVSSENTESLVHTENTVASEQSFKEKQELDSPASSTATALQTGGRPNSNEEIFQKGITGDTQSTLQGDNAYSQAQGSFTWASYFQAIGIMLFLLLVLWYVLKLVRKFGNGRFLPSQKLLPRESLYLEGQLPLGPGKSVVVANILGQRLVLGVTEKNITLITKMVDNEDLEYEQIFQEKLQETE